jgi:hypothetical protein
MVRPNMERSVIFSTLPLKLRHRCLACLAWIRLNEEYH